MFTLRTIACSLVLGILLTAVVSVCLIGHGLGVVFAADVARALVGVRPI
jgi:hypothetical protein